MFSFRKTALTALCTILSVVIFASVLCSASAPDSAYYEKPVVVLDAGHGGYDGGTTAGIQCEKVYNLLLAQYVRDYLVSDGRIDVIMTRDSDTFLSFCDRALYAYNNSADVLISLHCNSSNDATASGVLAITSRIEDYSAYTLGNSILSSISNATGLRNRGTESKTDTGDALGVYYWSYDKNWDMPGDSSLGTVSDYYSMNTFCSKFGTMSLIVEHGYLSNDNDRSFLDVDANLHTIAYAEAQAIINYYCGHTHVFTENKVVDCPSNCMFGGSVSYHCTICGLKACTERLSVDSSAHFWRKVSETAATCTEDGKTEYVCQITYNLIDKDYDCDLHTYTETVPATGHQYEIIDSTPAGHGVDGSYVEKCTVCGEVNTVVTEGEAHTYEIASQTFPDCTNDGVTVYVCSVCGDTYEETSEKLGHDYQLTEEHAPTCTENGDKTYTCTRCGDTYSETVDAAGHSYTETIIDEGSCTTPVVTEYVCSVCGDSYTETAATNGHKYEITDSSDSTCTSEGYITYICSVCGDTYTETTPVLEHDFDDDGVCLLCGYTDINYCKHTYTVTDTYAPTCTEAGSMTYVCTKCGSSYTEEIPPSGHDFEIIADSQPTCDTDGLYMATCRVCGYTESELRPCSGHEYTVAGKDEKHTYLVCSVCGESTTIENESASSVGEFFTNPLVIVLISLVVIWIGIVIYVLVTRKLRRKKYAAYEDEYESEDDEPDYDSSEAFSPDDIDDIDEDESDDEPAEEKDGKSDDKKSEKDEFEDFNLDDIKPYDKKTDSDFRE